MRKLFFLLLLISTNAFADAECYQQKNPMGYKNYDICEVGETGYICVTLEGKNNAGISCFQAPKKNLEIAKKEENHIKKHSESAFDYQ